MLLVDRDVLGSDLPLRETDPVRRLRAGKDHLTNPQLHSRINDVVGADCVDAERLVVGTDEDRRDRREMHDGVVPGNTGATLHLVDPGVRRQSVEDLPGNGQIDAQIRDPRVTERHDVGVDDPVPLFDEMSDRIPTRLTTPTGEEHPHLRDRTHRLMARSGGDAIRWRPVRGEQPRGWARAPVRCRSAGACRRGRPRRR